MVYLICLLITCVAILLLKDYHNRYSWILIMMVIGMCVAISAVIFQVVKLGNYHYIRNAIFGLDYKFFTYVSRKMTIPFSTVLRRFSGGIIVYLFSVPLFVYELTKTRYQEKRCQIHDIKKMIVLAILPIVYFYFYDPGFGYLLFLMAYKNHSYITTNLIITIVKYMDLFMKVGVMFYLLYPLYVLFKHYIETNISYVKKQILSMGICLLCLNTFFYNFFFLGPFKVSYKNLFQYSFWNLYNVQEMSLYYFSYLPMSMLLIIGMILFIHLRYRMTSTIWVLEEKIFHKNIKELNGNMRGIFHSHKNTLFAFKIIAEQIKAQYGTDQGYQSVQELIQYVDTSLVDVSRALDSFKQLDILKVRHRVFDSIELALREINVPKDINIKMIYTDYEIYVYFDQYHLVQVMTNLLNNAIEAIQCSDVKMGEIEIQVSAQYEWVYVEVKDNGVGISKAERKKIFQPFYSSKSKTNNWGIGLSYVREMIKANLGHIWVESEEEKYTAFQMLLPISK